MFNYIYKFILSFMTIYGFYYVLMALFAFKKTKRPNNNKYKNYFAILIAARNEEKVIKNLIESLKKQNYDKSKFEINVIINNCTDNTKEIAKKAGANIIDCKTKISSKAEALRYAFNELKDKKIDAYIIFDADNVVDCEFLNKMNASINNGYEVAQGNRDTKNVQSNWISSSYAIYYYLQNFFFNRARRNIGLSATLNGTGFMIKKSVIDRIGFNTVTLTEDIEFSGICALNNIRIDYVEDAITYDEQPTKFGVSCKQRMRWTNGTNACLKKYFWPLLKQLFKTGNVTCFDLMLLYLSAILQVVSFVFIAINLLITVVNLTSIKLLFETLTVTIISSIITYILGIVISIFVLIYNKRKITEASGGVFLFVLFVASWLPINIACLFKRKITWTPIKHDSNVSIEEITSK